MVRTDVIFRIWSHVFIFISMTDLWFNIVKNKLLRIMLGGLCAH